MKIKSVTLQNFCGACSTWNIDPVHVFVGDSFTGKTRILDGIKVGLLSYHPTFGKKPHLFEPCMSGSQTVIGLTLTDSTIVKQSWTRDKSSIKWVGPSDAMCSAVLFNVREWFSLTGPQRMRYVFDRLDLASRADEILDECQKVHDRITLDNPKHEQARAKVKAVIDGLEVQRQSEEPTPQEFLNAVVESLKAEKMRATVSCDQMRGLVEGQAVLSNAPAKNRESDLRPARADLDSLNATIAVRNDQDKAFHEWSNRISDERLVLNRHSGPSEALEKAKSELATKREELSSIQVRDAGDTLQKATTQLAVVQQHLASLRYARDELKQNHKSAMAQSKCPYCKSSRSGWKDHLIEEFSNDLKSLEGEINSVTNKEDAAVRNLEVEKAHSESVAAAWKARQELVDAIEDLQALVDSASKSNEAIVQTKAVIASLENNPVAQPESAETLLQKRSELCQRISEMESEHRQWIANKGIENNAVQARERALVAEADAEAFAAAYKYGQSMQARFTKLVMGSLSSVVEKFTAGILKAPMEFRDGVLGYEHAGVWVTHETFSGTEQAVAYAGLAVALAANESKIKLVIIDELGIMDDATREFVLARMKQLVDSGEIDQFIGAASCEIKMDGVTVTDLGGQEK